MKRLVLTLIASLAFACAFSQTIYIFGGFNNEEYLGILNASPYNSESIWNPYGQYGSRYNANSIWNKYGTYGSKYNSYSPWNKYSSTTPILVDENGNYYGHFNANNSNELIRYICKLAPLIQDDEISLSDAYDLLFR